MFLGNAEKSVTKKLISDLWKMFLLALHFFRSALRQLTEIPNFYVREFLHQQTCCYFVCERERVIYGKACVWLRDSLMAMSPVAMLVIIKPRQG